MRPLTVRITRHDLERNGAPRWESDRVETDPNDRVIDVRMRGTGFGMTSQARKA